MKVKMMPVVYDVHELSTEIEKQFGLEDGDINFFELFGEMCENDSYQRLCYDEEAFSEEQENLEYAEQYRPDDADHYRTRLLVLTYLRDTLPEHDEIIWNCSW